MGSNTILKEKKKDLPNLANEQKILTVSFKHETIMHKT